MGTRARSWRPWAAVVLTAGVLTPVATGCSGPDGGGAAPARAAGEVSVTWIAGGRTAEAAPISGEGPRTAPASPSPTAARQAASPRPVSPAPRRTRQVPQAPVVPVPVIDVCAGLAAQGLFGTQDALYRWCLERQRAADGT